MLGVCLERATSKRILKSDCNHFRFITVSKQRVAGINVQDNSLEVYITGAAAERVSFDFKFIKTLAFVNVQCILDSEGQAIIMCDSSSVTCSC
jgi:hypothetical protein